jgi:hypothetical protein
MGLNVGILKTGYLNVRIVIQNTKLENHIEIKGGRSLRYLGSLFTNSGNCNKEMLNRIWQARKATRARNSLLWSKYISVNTKEKYIVEWSKALQIYSLEILTVDYKFKKNCLVQKWVSGEELQGPPDK